MPSIFFNPTSSFPRAVPHSTREPQEFHRRLFGNASTPLVSLPALASSLGVQHCLVKDETDRFGLPAFKILGASWAVYKELTNRFPELAGSWSSFEQARAALQDLGDVSLVAASEGNHGRAVARMAGLLGLNARIVLPKHCSGARRRAIEREGATVEIVDGGYDESVEYAFSLATDNAFVIQDASIRQWKTASQYVVEGYSTMLWEIEDNIAENRYNRPTHVFVQVGVGSFGDAVVRHFRHPPKGEQPFVTAVEPVKAACAFEAARSGQVVTLTGPPESRMVGLNCGTMSTFSFETLSGGIDAFVQIEDRFSSNAAQLLHENGIMAGMTGAASLGGLLAVRSNEMTDANRRVLGLDERSSVLVFVTEGMTDVDEQESH